MCWRKPEHPGETYVVEESRTLYITGVTRIRPGIEPGTSEVTDADVTIAPPRQPNGTLNTTCDGKGDIQWNITHIYQYGISV